MTEVLIWTGEEEDAAALAVLEAHAFQGRSWGENNVKASFVAPRVTVLLAGSNKKAPIGFAMWRDLGPEAELLTIGVAPASRGLGIAKALLEKVCEGARSSGAERLFLEVDTNNEPAKALYMARGFEQTGLRRAYYRDGADALILQMTL